MAHSLKGRDPFEYQAHHIDRLMHRFLHGTLLRLGPKEPWQPPADVYELEDEIHVVVDLAGVSRERVEVILEGDVLFIRGWRDDPAPRKRVRLHQIEIDHGDFQRAVRIEALVDRDRLEAVYRDGFLRIRLPKMRDLDRREVEIRAPAEESPEEPEGCDD